MSIASTTTTTKRSAGQRGCEFNDDMLLDQTSNDYTGFQEDVSFRWDDKNNDIPFFIQEPVRQEEDATVIREAMKMFERETNGCVKFWEVDQINAPSHHLDISIKYEPEENGGTSGFVNLGTPGKKDKVTMEMINHGPEGYILDEFIVLHELGHVLGLAHTHKRFDSYKHININYDCIKTTPDNMTSQFTPHTQNELKIFDEIPYMCNSMMHYGPTTWAKKPGCITITAKSDTCKQEGVGWEKTRGMPIKEDWDLIKLIHCTA